MCRRQRGACMSCRVTTSKSFRASVGFVVVALLAAVPGLASAGVDAWSTGGPFDQPVLGLAIDPSNPMTIYAGTAGPSSTGDVFQSLDGGGSWHGLDVGSSLPRTCGSVVIDPANPSTVYAS